MGALKFSKFLMGVIECSIVFVIFVNFGVGKLNAEVILSKLKKSYLVVFALWIVTVAVAYISKSGAVAAFTIFLTGVLPFIVVLIWLAGSVTGKAIRGYFKKWHASILLLWFLFVYSIYAKKWAASLINEVFHVDANFLGITYTLLAALFTPFGILYQQSILENLWAAVIVAGVAMAGFFPFMLLLPIGFKKIVKIVGFTFGVVYLSSFFVAIVASISVGKKNLVREFALWADFNTEHLCNDSWASKAYGVVFLGGDRVLVYLPTNPDGSRFVVETCDFSKSF